MVHLVCQTAIRDSTLRASRACMRVLISSSHIRQLGRACDSKLLIILAATAADIAAAGSTTTSTSTN